MDQKIAFSRKQIYFRLYEMKENIFYNNRDWIAILNAWNATFFLKKVLKFETLESAFSNENLVPDFMIV